MTFPLGGFKNIFSSLLYSDFMEVSRYTQVLNPDGTTDSSNEVVLQDIPCRVSFTRQFNDVANRRDEGIYVDHTPTLFCRPEIALKINDYVKVYRKDDNGETFLVYEGHIGQPIYYPTHIQVLFTVKEIA